MDEEQNMQRILSFLRRCQSASSEALNIAKYLGLRNSKEVRPLLVRLNAEGKVINTGTKWQLSRTGLQPNSACGADNTGDTEVFVPTPAANKPARLTERSGRSRSAKQLESSDVVDTTRRSLPEDHSRRRSEGTVSAYRSTVDLCFYRSKQYKKIKASSIGIKRILHVVLF